MAEFVALNSGDGISAIPDEMKPIMREATAAMLAILQVTPLGLRRNVLSSVMATLYRDAPGHEAVIVGDFDYLVERTLVLIRLANESGSGT